MFKKVNRQTVVAGIVAVAAPIMIPMLTANEAAAEAVTIKRVCKKGICGKATWVDGTVFITLGHKLSRATHYNFKTNPGDQIEISGKYSFGVGPGESGTYSAQACDRGGIGARSSCTQWATFDWSSGEEELDEE